MSLSRRNPRRDLNEPAIIAEFKKAGASVEQTSKKGAPDLEVGFLGVNHKVEVKRDSEPLTPEQTQWHREWKGERPLVVRTEAHAQKALRMWTAEFAERSKQEAEGAA